MKFAVIKTGGKQYLVKPGDRIKIEKLPGEDKDRITFGEVLLIADKTSAAIGMPTVKGAAVEARIIRRGRARKIVVFRYHSKTRYRKKKGHRQPFTEVEITEIKEATPE
jgi:large subunit ribosomal protein L21